jgi:hypothetical protein
MDMRDIREETAAKWELPNLYSSPVTLKCNEKVKDEGGDNLRYFGVDGRIVLVLK